MEQGGRWRTPDDVFEIFDELGSLEYLVQTRYLDEPSNIVGNEVVPDHPFSEFVPFTQVPIRLSFDPASRREIASLPAVDR